MTHLGFLQPGEKGGKKGRRRGEDWLSRGKGVHREGMVESVWRKTGGNWQRCENQTNVAPTSTGTHLLCRQ